MKELCSFQMLGYVKLPSTQHNIPEDLILSINTVQKPTLDLQGTNRHYS